MGGAITGAINAGIIAFTFFEQASIPVTLDKISNKEITVLGEGVLLALTLTIIQTSIQYLIFSKELKKLHNIQKFPRPYWTWGFRIAIRSGVTAFGFAMVFAVLWQRYIGTIEVSPMSATLIMFFLAFSFTVYASVSIRRAMLQALES